MLEPQRRRFLLSAAAGAGLAMDGIASAATAAPAPTMAVRQVDAGVLDVGVHETGPAEGRPVILLHGFPYDIHSYVEVAPLLARQGFRVIVPYLRGHGSTRFLDAATPRAGQQAALGQDLIDLMDALHIPEAVLAGYDWGGRAACVAAALWPTRCVGLVAVNGYQIQDIARAAAPAPAAVEAGAWYQYYFLTERGRAGLAAHRADIARLVWKTNSPAWQWHEATLARAARAFDNPDYVDVVLHACRHGLGQADGFPEYAAMEARLAAAPPIPAPAITLDGLADGAVAAGDGGAWKDKFTGPWRHRRIAGAGHDLPREAPADFADAVAELARGAKWRT